MNQDEYQMGKTKLFIKAPESVRNRCILFFLCQSNRFAIFPSCSS